MLSVLVSFWDLISVNYCFLVLILCTYSEFQTEGIDRINIFGYGNSTITQIFSYPPYHSLPKERNSVWEEMGLNPGHLTSQATVLTTRLRLVAQMLVGLELHYCSEKTSVNNCFSI